MLPLLAFTLLVRPDTLVVLNKMENSAAIMDPSASKTRFTVKVGNGPHEVAISPDGMTAAVANYGDQTPGHTLTLINLQTGEATKTLDVSPHERPHGVLWLDDKTLLISAEREQKVLELNVDSGKVEQQFDTTQQATHMLALSPDKKRLYTANIGSGSISAIDLPSGKLAGTVACGKASEGIDVSPDGKQVWVSNGGGDTVSVVDTETLKKIADIPTGKRPLRVKVTPDGKRAIITCVEGGQIMVVLTADYSVAKTIDTAKLEPAPSYEGAPGPLPLGVVIDGAGKHGYIACMAAQTILVLDLDTLEVTGRFPTGLGPDGMAIHG